MRATGSLQMSSPQVCNHVFPAGVEVPAANVGVGTHLLVRPGDMIATDGVVAKGRSDVDQSLLTGESAAVKKGTGDEVGHCASF